MPGPAVWANSFLNRYASPIGFPGLPVTALDANLTPDRIYDARLLTFRGSFL